MERKFVSLFTGVQMEYVDQGHPGGTPVVFLHGGTDSWRSFERVLALLPQIIHAYAISARGHGDSSRPERGYLLLDMSADLLAFMDAVELEQAVIVGHSMGSMVAQRFGVDHPERVSGLVLTGAFATLFQDPGLTEFHRSTIASLVDPIDARFAREWQQSTLARPMSADHLDTVVAETLKVPARVWHAAFAGWLTTAGLFGGPRPRVRAVTDHMGRSRHVRPAGEPGPFGVRHPGRAAGCLRGRRARRALGGPGHVHCGSQIVPDQRDVGAVRRDSDGRPGIAHCPRWRAESLV